MYVWLDGFPCQLEITMMKDPYSSIVYVFFFFKGYIYLFLGLPDGSAGKESTCNAGDLVSGFNPWVGKIPWRREKLPTPVELPTLAWRIPWTEEPTRSKESVSNFNYFIPYNNERQIFSFYK